MHVVVGGSGQLGTVLVRQLLAAGRPVRAFVRPMSRYQHLNGSGAVLVFGDLRDAASVREAVRGADVVLATANTVAPAPGDTSELERAGYRSLIDESVRQDVRRFVLVSVPVTHLDEKVPLFAVKRYTEKTLIASGVPYTILRCAQFMEVWLALPGSSVPLRGEENPTLERPYPFLRRFRRMTGRTIEDKGRMTVIGPASLRNSFVSLHDVARMMIAVADSEDFRNQVVNVGGPEVLTWNDVAGIYAEVLGRPVRVTSLPPVLFHVMQVLLRPFAPGASNTMAMNRLGGSTETPWDGNELAHRLGVAPLRTVRDFLAEKAALPDRA